MRAPLRERLLVKFLKEVNKNGVDTLDALLGDAAWEFKIPEGYNGEHTVRNQFYKALGKEPRGFYIVHGESCAGRRGRRVGH